MRILDNKVAIKHALADMLYGDVDSGEFDFQVDAEAFKEAIADIQSGQPIFKTPKVDFKPKLNKKALLKIGE